MITTQTWKIGDCIELMQEIEDESIDLVLTDPPYNYGKEFANDCISMEKFDEFNLKWVKEVYRVLKKNTIFVCFHSPRTFISVLDIARSVGFEFLRTLTIYKPNDCTFPWHGWLLKSELVLIFQKEKGIFTDSLHTHDVYTFNHCGGELGKLERHPSVKPLKIVRDLVLKTSRELDLVLDPFLGSGTTLRACRETNRNAIGYEINVEYESIIRNRCMKETPSLSSYF